MLPKQKRLKAVDFRGIIPQPVFRGTFFDVRVAPATSTKFACIVAKKRIRRAVDRNTARRKVYALIHNTTTVSPLLVFIYPTKAILQAPHTTLKDELNRAFATL